MRRKRQERRGQFRMRTWLRAAIDPHAGAGPWLYARLEEMPTQLAPGPGEVEQARSRLSPDTERTINISASGVGLAIPPDSELHPGERLTLFLGLGPPDRPLDIVAALPARVIRVEEGAEGTEAGLQFETGEPALEHLVAGLVHRRDLGAQ